MPFLFLEEEFSESELPLQSHPPHARVQQTGLHLAVFSAGLSSLTLCLGVGGGIPWSLSLAGRSVGRHPNSRHQCLSGPDERCYGVFTGSGQHYTAGLLPIYNTDTRLSSMQHVADTSNQVQSIAADLWPNSDPEMRINSLFEVLSFGLVCYAAVAD